VKILLFLVLKVKDCNGKPDPKFLRRVTPKSIAIIKFNFNKKIGAVFNTPFGGLGG
jgi:hypothetical protein